MMTKHGVTKVKEFSPDQLSRIKEIFGDEFEHDLKHFKIFLTLYHARRNIKVLTGKERKRGLKSLERKCRHIIHEIRSVHGIYLYVNMTYIHYMMDDLEVFCDELSSKIENTTLTSGRPPSLTRTLVCQIERILKDKNIPFNSSSGGPAITLLEIALDVCGSNIVDHRQLIDEYLKTKNR